ncbi:hypothetical protein C2857_002729 [Epichloe festucae Fl1]|uniref:Uncharacterized protein n=1 Tax=Epichloe festucae (strain Fl1) TaxID=877507 RepID=A0A7S9KK35_EPIFF|nr:hypothetical protein C2857_002729 [Epichloe festucae Fl1]
MCDQSEESLLMVTPSCSTTPPLQFKDCKIMVLQPAAEKSKAAQVQPWVHLIAGATGGMVTATITSPLDVLRTRLQSDLHRTPFLASDASNTRGRPIRNPFRHVYDTFCTIGTIRGREGWRGLFRGLGPSLAGVVPATAVKFYVYGNCKQLAVRYLDVRPDKPETRLPHGSG